MKSKPLHLVLKLLKFLFPLVEKNDREIYGHMTEKQLLWKWYAPQILVWSLLPGALLYLFWPLFNPNITLFSNDGPLGVMNSRWMREGYPPGQPMWNDSWWLGMGAERTPIMITNTFHWIAQNPILCVATLNLIAAIVYYALRSRYNKSLLPYEPEGYKDDIASSDTVVDKSTAVLYHRIVFLTIAARFTWVYFATLDKPWDVDAVTFPLEGLVIVGYLFLGLPLWLSDEMENRDYMRILSERSSKQKTSKR